MRTTGAPLVSLQRHPSPAITNVQGVGHLDPNSPVDASVSRDISFLGWRDERGYHVIHFDGNQVCFPELQCVCDVENKARVSADVLAYVPAIDPHVRHLKRSIEVRQHPAAAPRLRHFEPFPVPAYPVKMP